MKGAILMATVPRTLFPWLVFIETKVVYEAFTHSEAQVFVDSYVEISGTASPVICRNAKGGK